MREAIEHLLASAGIEPGGPNPWDIQIHHPGWYERVWTQRQIGLGDSYMDGWWDCPSLDAFITRLLLARADRQLKLTPGLAFRALLHRAFNFQNRHRAKEVAYRHYDLGNGLFQAMLDPTMTYSCGYWKGAQTLAQAQQDKLELVCSKLGLRPGMTLLDIGCGWGGLAHYAAKRYGARVVGITLSEPQRRHAEAVCHGLPVTFRLQDYREIPSETFDRIVSIGMFEHVGHKNYSKFLDIVASHLSPDGVLLLHTLGTDTTHLGGDPWLTKHIFPNGELPSVAQIGRALEGRFKLEDWHNFGADYDRTLLAWQRNFTENWEALKGEFDARFQRMWNYYLLSCAGACRARELQLWQLVLSRNGIPGGFRFRDLA